MMAELSLQDFPLQTYDKIRYADTDRQGHVNNAKFATFLETGRVEVLYNPAYPIRSEGASFVIASLKLDFLKEIKWPGKVEIGTGITKIGNSSIRLLQQLFQDDVCVAKAETVIAQIDDKTGKGALLTNNAKKTLSNWLFSDVAK